MGRIPLPTESKVYPSSTHDRITGWVDYTGPAIMCVPTCCYAGCGCCGDFDVAEDKSTARG